ncbi:MAG: hypothetical protein IPG33_16790 [Betaproteobacteria bacterium]|nr:hypothetical protein [Betaproteobacteria bacterium]
MSTLRFDAIVFDFDGVLAESVDVKTRAFASLYETYGADVVKQVVAWHLAHGGVSRYEKFRHFHQAFRPHAGAGGGGRTGRAFLRPGGRSGDRRCLGAGRPRIPGRLACAAACFYVASGTPEAELVRIIERRGMTRYFAGAGWRAAQKGRDSAGFSRPQRSAARVHADGGRRHDRLRRCRRVRRTLSRHCPGRSESVSLAFLGAVWT